MRDKASASLLTPLTYMAQASLSTGSRSHLLHVGEAAASLLTPLTYMAQASLSTGSRSHLLHVGEAKIGEKAEFIQE